MVEVLSVPTTSLVLLAGFPRHLFTLSRPETPAEQLSCFFQLPSTPQVIFVKTGKMPGVLRSLRSSHRSYQPRRFPTQGNEVSPSWAALPILSTQPIKSQYSLGFYLLQTGREFIQLAQHSHPLLPAFSHRSQLEGHGDRWEQAHLPAGWAPTSAMGVEGWSSGNQSSSALVLLQKTVWRRPCRKQME